MRLSIDKAALIILLSASLAIPAVCGQEGQISCSNTSRYIGDGQWECGLFIVAPTDVLAEIARVEYTLPDSFRKAPVLVTERGDADTPFLHRLTIRGKFPISARVGYVDGKTVTLNYKIQIEEQRIDEDRGIRVRYETDKLPYNQWEWTAYLRGPNEILEQIRLVKYTCAFTIFDMTTRSSHEVFKRGPINQSYAVSGYAAESFTLDACIYFNDGKYQLLSQRINMRGLPD
jgi:hypothetical protein